MQVEKLVKNYHIRSYECDQNKNLRLVTLMNVLQDMAVSHSEILNLGLNTLTSQGFAWVGVAYQIKIERLPKLDENIKVTTWPSKETPVIIFRDFMVQDEFGKVIISASSQWVIIDVERRRPMPLKRVCSNHGIIDEQAINADFSKLAPLNKVDFSESFLARFDDVDLNGHVNNAIYPLWASEALPNDFRTAHLPAEVLVFFKKETRLGEKVLVQTNLQENTSFHSILSLTDNRELAQVKIGWKKL